MKSLAVFAVLCVSQVSAGDYDVLNHLLEGFTISIPEQDYKILDIPVKVKDTVLSDMSINDLDFSTTVAPHAKEGTLDFDINVALKLDTKVDGIKMDATIDDVKVVGSLKLSNPNVPLEEGDAVLAHFDKFDVTAECHLLFKFVNICGDLVHLLGGTIGDTIQEVITKELVQLSHNVSDFNARQETPEQITAKVEKPFEEYINTPDIIKFSNPNSTVAGIVSMIDQVYGTIVPNSQPPNTMLGELLEHRLHSIKVGSMFSLLNDSINITIQAVKATELNMPVFDIKPLGDFTFEIDIELRDSVLELDLGLSMQNPDGSYKYVTNTTAKVMKFSMDIHTTIMVVANGTQYGDVSLSSMLPLPQEWTADAIKAWAATHDTAHCLVACPLHGLEISSMNTTLINYDLDVFFINDVLSKEVNTLANAAQLFIPKGLTWLVDQGSQELTELLSVNHSTEPNPCAVERYPESHLTAAPGELQNFSDSRLLETIDFVINDVIGSDGPWGIDAFLNYGLQKAMPLLTDTILLHIPKYLGYFKVEIKNAQVIGAPSITNMLLLKAASQYNLSNSLDLKGFNVSVDLSIALWGENQVPFSDSLRIYLGFDIINARDVLSLVFNPDRFLNQPLRQNAEPGCAESNLVSIGFPNTDLQFTNFAFIIDCIACDSKGMEALRATMTSTAGAEQMEAGMNWMLGQADHVLNSPMVTDKLQNGLNSAEKLCDYNQTEAPIPSDDSEDSHFMSVARAMGFIFGCAIVLAICLTAYSVRAHRAWKKDLEARGEKPMTKSSHMPLIWHPSMSAKTRYGVLFFLMGTVSMFLSSNIPPVGMGAVVHAHVTLGGSLIKANDIFSYSLGNTVSDMWNAKVYALSLLVGFLSGVWPYCKMVSLVWCWLVPPSALGHSNRERVLCVLDFFGKWSLIDSFMVMMMMCAFELKLTLPDTWVFVPEGLLELQVIVTPYWGLFGFMTAAILSLTVNHAMVMLHRQAVLYDETDGVIKGWFDEFSDASDHDDVHKRITLASHPSVPGEAEGEPMKRAAISICLLLTALVLLIAGVSIDTFRFTFEGLAGWGCDLDSKNSAATGYSIIKLANNVMGQATTTREHIEYGYLVVMFMLFAVVVPIVQIVTLLFLWLAPLTLKEQKIVYFANEVIAAWSALEVFIVVLIATLLEIGQLVVFLIGHSCDGINEVMKDVLQPLGYLDDLEPKCFDVKSELTSGCWILFSGAICAQVAYLVAHRSAAKLISARQEHMEETMPLLKESKNKSSNEVNRASTNEISDEDLDAPGSDDADSPTRYRQELN